MRHREWRASFATAGQWLQEVWNVGPEVDEQPNDRHLSQANPPEISARLSAGNHSLSPRPSHSLQGPDMAFHDFDAENIAPHAARHALPGLASGRDLAPLGLYRNGGKRVLDVTLILLSLPVLLPMMALLILAVALSGGRPLFRQQRIGRDGRSFTLWKLRSMVPDAEARLEAYLAANPEARAEWDRTQKLKSDPRITRIGKILRRTSADELPQLWNVLRGEMSLIGPRPMMPCQRDLYPGKAYYRLRPGLTGPWQVSARNDSSFADRARFDTAYAREVSLRTDLRLLLATVRVVLRRTGY